LTDWGIYVVPSSISNDGVLSHQSPYSIESLRSSKLLITENPKTCRSFLKQCGIEPPYDAYEFVILDKKSNQNSKGVILSQIKEARLKASVISEAGSPGIADPGQEFLQMAYELEIPVYPVVGPSAIFLSISVSGLNGQNFAFNGYLPVKEKELLRKLKDLEKRSRNEKQSQFFIETPYRSQRLLDFLIKHLDSSSSFHGLIS